jgi:hypothetical protein
MSVNFTLASSTFNVSAVSLTFPESTSNNLALYVFSDTAYSIATIVKYISYLVVGASVLFFLTGYFGGKLQSLEGIAVVQLAALLLVTLKNMGPTFAEFSHLRYSLGITPIYESKYSYESTDIATHLKSVFYTPSTILLINIALAIVLAPVLISIFLKVLSVTVCKDS